jgi:protein O-GlcNAcase/histone acetyltransferase
MTLFRCRYILISLAEALVVVTGLDFAFSQCPPSMHSLVQALWATNQALGTSLIALLSSTGVLPDQFTSGTFYALSAAMAACLIAHIWASRRYTYTNFFHVVEKSSSLSLELLQGARISSDPARPSGGIPFTEQSNDISSEIDIVANVLKPALIYQVDRQLFAGFKHHDGIFSNTILSRIDSCVDAIDIRIRTASSSNGKVLFLFSGCGTSGRYAFQCARSFQDAVSKCSASAASCIAFDFTIAGGDISIVASQELPEDDPAAGQRDMAAVVARHNPTHVVFFGITCGLSAPYVAGQICATMQEPDFYTSVLIGFNYPEMARNVPVEGWNRTCHAVFNQLARQSQAYASSFFLLNPIIGPEAITGSSRMKGGSMTKMILDTVCACSLKRSNVLGSRASLVPRPSVNVLNRLRQHRLADLVESNGAAVDVVCMLALYQEVLDALNCDSVHSSIANVLDITQKSDHVYIVGSGSLAVVGLIDLSEMPDTYGAPFDEMRGFTCGGWRSMLSATSPVPTVTSPDVPVFMGQISSDDFLKDILPNLSSADCVIFLSSSPNIDENSQNVAEAERVLQATVASKASRKFSVVVVEFVDSVNSNHGSYGDAVDVNVQVRLPYSHALSYGYLFPRPLVPTYVEMACKWLLNCITTNTQVGKGVVVGNTMVNMQVANDKLFHRCIRIIQNLAGGGADGDAAKLSLVRAIWNEDDSEKLLGLLSLATSDHVKHSIGSKKKFVISKAILLASSNNKMRVSDAENILKSEKVVRKAIASVSKTSFHSHPTAPVAPSATSSAPRAVSMSSEAPFFCGIIEGFYGEPWKMEARFDMISRLNSWTGFRSHYAHVRPSYMYGPKDDRKHRDVWRELYNEAELRDLNSLVRHCESNAVTFVFALSPGLDIRFSKTEDLDFIFAKFNQLINIGVSAFALFFDDLPNGGGLSADDSKCFKSVAFAQASVANSVHAWLQATLKTGFTLCFCPTQYCTSLCEPDLGTSTYLQDLATTLSPDVLLFWTGDSIISETVSYCSISKLANIFSRSRPETAARRIILWDNLYANDYDINRAYLGSYQGRSLELCSRIAGIMINPNCNLHINFMPMRSLCRFVECGARQLPYNFDECRKLCASEWTPLFDGPITTENVVLISDLLHLPYKMGALGSEYVHLLSQVFGDAPGSSHFPEKFARLQDLCRLVVQSFERLVQCQNRNIVFALLDRFWGIKEEALLHLEMIAHVQRGAALQEFSLIKYFAPHTYRGGWLSTCRQVILMHPLNGTFSVNPDTVRSHSVACGPFQLEPFQEEHRDGMYRICLLTGDSGADGTHLYPSDQQALGRRWVGPYLDLEPGLSFALVDGAAVVGYVLASADTEQMYRALKKWYFPRLASHFPDPLVDDCSRLTESEREMCSEYHRPSLSLPASVSVADYPAHLHIDLAACAQRKGCGTIMINVITANLVRSEHCHCRVAVFHRCGFEF